MAVGVFFFFQAEDGIRDVAVTGVQTCALPICIVARLSGPVSTPRSDAGLIVTEHGVADLRGQTLSRRVKRLIDIAAPEHRADLEQQAHTLLRQCGAAFS